VAAGICRRVPSVNVTAVPQRRNTVALVILAALALGAATAWALWAMDGQPIGWLPAILLAATGIMRVREATPRASADVEQCRSRVAEAMQAACETAGMSRAPGVLLVAVPCPTMGARVTTGSPRVVVSTALVAALDDEQLRALFLHELAHLRSPRYASLSRSVVGARRWVPLGVGMVSGFEIGSGHVLPWLAVALTVVGAPGWTSVAFRRRAAREEFAADADAIASGADADVLAGALQRQYAEAEAYHAWLARRGVWWLLARPVTWTTGGAPTLQARLAAIGRAAT
jgi:Zn-dependent protease with chaperone function